MKVLYFASFLCVVHSHMMFQGLIPNGDKVPHPCRENDTWQGVGHQAEAGGGALNPFALDFLSNGKIWNETLCQLDSDGDGKSNGEELGDPECKWKFAGDNTDLSTSNLSHPGICEPLEDATCKALNDFDVCGSDKDSECDAVGDPDVIEVKLSLPSLPVPASVDTVMCQVFDIPSDRKYQLVGYELIIDNRIIFHHMSLLTCDLDADEELEKYRQPRECLNGVNSCPHKFIGGLEGPICWNSQDQYGLRLDAVRKVMLSVHWFNPEMKSGYTDGSGIKLYLTKRLKANDVGILEVRQQYIDLPAGQPAVEWQGGCSENCTRSLPEDIFLVVGYMHMHHLAISGKTELYRDNEKVHDILIERTWTHGHPNLTYLQPMRLKPSDEIRVTCVYNTTSRTERVNYLDEMCNAYFLYYPFFSNFTLCDRFGDLDVCLKPGKERMEYEECNAMQYANEESPNSNTTKEVLAQCDPTGDTCLPGCKEAIAALKTHPCEQGMYGKLVESLYEETSRGQTLVNALHSCEELPDDTDESKADD